MDRVIRNHQAEYSDLVGQFVPDWSPGGAVRAWHRSARSASTRPSSSSCCGCWLPGRALRRTSRHWAPSSPWTTRRQGTRRVAAPAVPGLPTPAIVDEPGRAAGEDARAAALRQWHGRIADRRRCRALRRPRARDVRRHLAGTFVPWSSPNRRHGAPRRSSGSSPRYREPRGRHRHRSAGGDVVAIETKAAASATRRDIRGLELLSAQLGARFKTGILVYSGEDTLALSDRVWALPLSGLSHAR